MLNALRIHEDIAELNWKVWGDQWTVPLSKLTGSIVLPGSTDKNQVFVFGHPNIDGDFNFINSNTVIFTVNGISSQQWVEVRTLFPKNILTSQSNAVIVSSDLNSILNEEQVFSKQSYSDYPSRPEDFITLIFATILMLLFFAGMAFIFTFGFLKIVQFMSTPIRIAVGIGMAFLFVAVFLSAAFDIIFWFGLIIFALIYYAVYWLFGREPKIEYEMIYEREIPYNYPPSIVSALFNQYTKRASSDCIIAEIMNLSLKGFFTIEKFKNEKSVEIFGWHSNPEFDYRLLFSKKFIDKSFDGLLEHEKILLGWFDEYRKNKPSISFLEFQKAVKKDHSFYASYEKYNSAIFDDAKKLKLFWSDLGEIIFLASITLLTFIGIAFYFFLSYLFLAYALMLLFPGVLTKRTQEGALHYSKWNNLKKFFIDFSRMNKKPVEHLILWEKYLVYAVPLGVAAEVQDVIKLSFSKEQSRIFRGSYSSINFNSFNSLSSSLASGIAFAGAPPSSSGSGGFGGGGDFSGGGGGGGGGGGFG